MNKKRQGLFAAPFWAFGGQHPCFNVRYSGILYDVNLHDQVQIISNVLEALHVLFLSRRLILAIAYNYNQNVCLCAGCRAQGRSEAFMSKLFQKHVTM